MSNWGQGQGGYQYPQQTGYPQQQQQQQFGQFGQPGIAPQPTGFPGQRPPFQQPQQTGFQQPQQTGFPGGPLLSQPTGFPGGGGFAQRPPPPPVPPVPSQFSQFQPRLAPQPTGFPGGGLQSQPTGYPGGPLVAQPTGFVDPRLQMMSSTFLPANQASPYTAQGAPQLQQPQQQLGGLSLQQSFQQHNQDVKGTAAPRVPWALSKGEKKSYDQIFRAWDASGSGFIDGQTAIQVFGQSGLDKDSLAKIWALADADNRGKLNIAEFHVAMGLIYRKLNGNEIPDKLPQELVPPSHRDLDDAVSFVKSLTKNDPVRSSSPSGGNSYLKVRSFGDREAPGAGGRQDATVYKHAESQPAGGFYTPRSRHIDRNDVRGNNDRGDSSDISDLKRQLEKSASRLDDVAAESASRTREDEELDREMDDLRYRAKRIKDDLEYLERAPRTSANDDERRRLERNLLTLLHERIPDVERRVKDREARREREKRDRDRARDDRNQSFGRFNDRDRDREPYRSYSRNEDRSYSRNDDRYGDYDRDRDRDRDYRDRDRERDRYDDRDRLDDRGYDRPPARTPPPGPPAAPPANNISKPPPAPPAPTASPAPNLKNMSPAERQAYIKEQAAKRLADRMAALGVAPSPGPPSAVDTSVEDRLAQERKEAEEKTKEQEKAAEERERLRRERLNNEKGIKDTPPAAPAPPAPAPAARKPGPPPPPVKKAPAPPPPRGVLKSAIKPPAAAPTFPIARAAPVAPPPPAVPTVDPEEERLKQREAELKAQREARAARLRELEEQEEQDRKREEERLEARMRARKEAEERRRLEEEAEQARAHAASAPPPVAAPPPPPPPPAPPAPAGVASPGKFNPFSKMMADGGAAASPSTNGGNNPFFKPQAPAAPAAPPAPPAVVPPPRAPSAPAGTYNVATNDSEDEWGVEKDDDDSSDDEISKSRNAREQIAKSLFGGILPSASPAPAPRPQSAAGRGLDTPTPTNSAFVPPAPPAPAPPPAPPAPGAPPAPPPPAAFSAPAAAPGDRGALLGAIQGGARLRKTVTNDRSAAPVGGRVIGDTAPPAHINIAPVAREPSPPPPPPPAPPAQDDSDARNPNRQSVDWYAGLAADHGVVSREPSGLGAPREEDEDEAAEGHGGNGHVPDIAVHESEVDPLEDVDKSKVMRVRTLYPYEGQRPEDITFGENMVLTASPSKSGGDWWYGTAVRDGKAGFFPKAYVQEVETVKAKALYAYEGTSPDELPFAENDELTVVDRGEPDWWKVEQGGVVFIVPAAYLEVVSG